MKRLLILLTLLAMTAGCPVTQPQQTPVPPLREASKATGTPYWLYVPSYYNADRNWPLVITLHGTYGWDGSQPQISEWKALAEQRGLIVAAPDLKSAQGILPVVRSVWYGDLDTDEKAILTLIDELVAQYHVDPNAVLLTGFSAGGYAMYYVGLRNPQRFNMLIARACNGDVQLFDEKIPITDAVRKLPVAIFWGKDDLQQIQAQSWAAFQYLRERGCLKAVHQEIQGGHLRRPELAYRLWRGRLPQKYRR
jgi:poly(3-hydroxybutyrate) depolymerase